MKMSSVFAAAGFICLGLAGGRLHAAEGKLDTNAVLMKMEEAGKTLKSLKAGFKQIRTYSLFGEKRESSGTIYYKKPGMMLWQYDAPDNSSLYINGRSALMYIPDIKQVQKISLSRDKKTEALLIGFGNSADEIKRNFNARSSPKGNGDYALELTPKTPELKALFSSLRLVIDGQRWIPVGSERREPGGDVTEFTFENIKINPPLKNSFFNFSIPKGVELVEY